MRVGVVWILPLFIYLLFFYLFLFYFFFCLFLFFLPLCESVGYRLKYCLKGQLSPKQPNKWKWNGMAFCFLTCGTESVLFLAVMENFALSMGWDSSHETLNVTSVFHKRYLRGVTENSEWRSELAVIFPIIGKKNNHSLVSDADREIPILGSTDDAGNSVNLVSGIIRLPSGWDFSVCIGGRW